MAIKDIITNPWVLAGATGAGYMGQQRYGRKYGKLQAAAAGAVVGGLAGWLADRYLINKAKYATLPTAQAQAQAQNGVGEYTDDGSFDLDDVPSTTHPGYTRRAAQAVNAYQQAEAAAQAAANEDLGSLTGGGGLGSFSDDRDIDEVVEEALAGEKQGGGWN